MDSENPASPARLYLGALHALHAGVVVAEAHRHHAVQISVALMQSFRIRLDGGPWVECAAAVIPADTEHAFDSGSGAVANVFLDVESIDYRDILQAKPHSNAESGQGFAVPPDLLQALRHFHGRTVTMRAASGLCERVVEAAFGTRPLRKALDSRIKRVLEMIGREPANKIKVGRLADSVALSPSRLAHLFAEQVGIPIRRYRIWKAIREASRLCLRGASLTEAAHAAGFTDSSHFSNTFRELFGIAPSVLLCRRPSMEIWIDDAGSR